MSSSDVEVNLEFTPNPDTLKYAVNRTLLAAGAANFLSGAAAEGKSPLATALFAVPNVSAVMIGKDFVTVTLSNQEHLHSVHEGAQKAIKDFLATGERAVLETERAPTANLSEIEKRIVEILDTEVRPAVAMDGGDISFEKYEDGFVYLKMQGSCSGCPSSMMTLKMGVETRLRQAIPEIQEVIPV